MIILNSNIYTCLYVEGTILHEEITAMLQMLISSTNMAQLANKRIEQNKYLHIQAKSSRYYKELFEHIKSLENRYNLENLIKSCKLNEIY